MIAEDVLAATVTRDEPVTDDKLDSNHEEADSSVYARLSSVLRVNNSTSSQSLDVAAEDTQKLSPTSNDLRNSTLPEGTPTISQSPSAVGNIRGAPCGQDAVSDQFSQHSSYVVPTLCLPSTKIIQQSQT